MSRIRELFGDLTRHTLRAAGKRPAASHEDPGALDTKREPVLAKEVAALSAATSEAKSEAGSVSGPANGDWQEIKERYQAKIRGLVSKSIVESIYVAPPVVIPVDPRDVLQATANRLYADVLYEIWSVEATPCFEPDKAVLDWTQEALEAALKGWKGANGDGEAGDYEPPAEVKQATTDAIWEALRQASKNDVLETAAKQRVGLILENVPK